jgi:hypothetical protein
LKSGGNLIGSGGCLCGALRRGGILFYRLRGSRIGCVGSRNEKSGNWSRKWTVSAFKVHWENASVTCSRSSPYFYVLATLAHYEGCNIFILLRSRLNDVVSHVGMSL